MTEKKERIEKCALCSLKFPKGLIEKFVSFIPPFYYLCYKCALRLNKRHDKIFSEERNYDNGEAFNKTLSFTETDEETEKTRTFSVMLAFQKFPKEECINVI